MTATAVRKDETTVAKVMRAAPGPIFEERAGRHPLHQGRRVDRRRRAPHGVRGAHRAADARARAGPELLCVARLLGGFHYAPGGNAAARAGGDEQAGDQSAAASGTSASARRAPIRAAWPMSPACRAARVSAVLGRSLPAQRRPFRQRHQRARREIADGNRNKPLIEASGRVAPDLDYATATAIMAGHGKQLLSFAEFSAAAYGVTERTAAGTSRS
jgi:hypothetical protein